MLVESMLPIFLYTGIGVALRVTGLIAIDAAPPLFRFVFLATLPALVFGSIVKAPLGGQALWLPVAGFTVNVVCGLVTLACTRAAGIDPEKSGTMVLCASIINMMFSFPFVLALTGQAGLTDAILFDIGNAIFVATVATSMALHYGHAGTLMPAASVLRLLRSPLFLALIAALTINLASVRVPPLVLDVLEPLGRATIPVTLVALGVSLSPAGLRGRLAAAAVGLRMLTGLAAGLLLVWLFGFRDLTAVIVVASAAAPVGFGAVTLAAVGKLDTELAASAVSMSVLIGMVTTTAMLWFGPALLGVSG